MKKDGETVDAFILYNHNLLLYNWNDYFNAIICEAITKPSFVCGIV